MNEITTAHVTDRPWRGPDATTGRTVDDFRDSFDVPPQYAADWPEWVTRAAVSICRSYGIRGVSDPAYIANVIMGEQLVASPVVDEHLPDNLAERRRNLRVLR